jgi:hypothetical protein
MPSPCASLCPCPRVRFLGCAPGRRRGIFPRSFSARRTELDALPPLAGRHAIRHALPVLPAGRHAIPPPARLVGCHALPVLPAGCHAPNGATDGPPRSTGLPDGPPRHPSRGVPDRPARSAGAPDGPPRHAPTGASGGPPRSAGANPLSSSSAVRRLWRARRCHRRFNSVPTFPWLTRARRAPCDAFGACGVALDGSAVQSCTGDSVKTRARRAPCGAFGACGVAMDGPTPYRRYRG